MNEQEVVNCLKRKDQEAFNYLYDHYAHLLYAVVLKIAEDEAASQDILRIVFAKTWDGLDDYKPGMRTLLGWMLEVARNTAMENCMARSQAMMLDIETSTGDTYIIKLATLQPAAQPQYKVVLDLVYYKGFTVKDIAVAIGIPEASITAHLRKALTGLREFGNDE